MQVTARHYRRIHAGLTVTWLLLGIPTMLWWINSIPWVVGMSWYALVASHWACFQAARAEENQDNGPCCRCSVG